MFLWWIIPFAGQETAEGIFLLGIMKERFFIERGGRGAFCRQRE